MLSIDKIIKGTIESELEKGHRTFIIYPFGEMGGGEKNTE